MVCATIKSNLMLCGGSKGSVMDYLGFGCSMVLTFLGCVVVSSLFFVGLGQVLEVCDKFMFILLSSLWIVCNVHIVW